MIKPGNIEKIADIPLGTRFQYQGVEHRQYVLLQRHGTGLCAVWAGVDAFPLVAMQGIYTVTDTEESFQKLYVIVIG